MRNKIEFYDTFPPTPPFFLVSTSLLIFPTLSSAVARWGSEIGIVISSSHVFFATPSSGGGLLTLLLHCGISPMGDTLSLIPWVLPTGCSPSRIAPAWIPHEINHKSSQQTCFNVGSSLHRATGPAMSLHHWRLPTGSEPLLNTSSCGSFMWLSAPSWTFMGDSLSHCRLWHAD